MLTQVWGQIQPILASIGAVILGGGIVVTAAFALFRLFSDKWLSAKFDERLETFKHMHQRELEELRLKINTLFDRTTKLHQREFEVVPEAWSKLIDAHNQVWATIVSFKQYPDLDRMNSVQLEEFFTDGFLSETQKEEIRNSSQKLKLYIRMNVWHEIWKSKKALRKFHVYLLKNGIFIAPEVRAKFKTLGDYIWAALVEYEINEQWPENPRERTAFKNLEGDGKKLMEQLESDVQGRLWN